MRWLNASLPAKAAILCLAVAFFPRAVPAVNTATFSGGQVVDMLYASDGVTRGGTYDFNLLAINPVYQNSVGFFNVAADFDSSGGITSDEWIVQNIPMRLDDGLTTQPGLSAWFDPGAFSINPSASYTTYATIEDTEIASPSGHPSWHTSVSLAGSAVWGANDPNGQSGPAPAPTGNSTTGGKTASSKRKGVPDIGQQRNECGPTSTANSLRWLAKEHGFENKLPANDDDLIKGLMKAMTGSDARPFGGLNGNQLYDGKKKYITDNNLPLIVKGGNTDPNASGAKAFDFIKSELDAGEDVEFLIKWPGVGSHWVTAVGWAVNGDRLFLEVNDPDDGKTGTVEWELKRDGTFVNPKGAMWWAVSESVPEPAALALMGVGTLLAGRRRISRQRA